MSIKIMTAVWNTSLPALEKLVLLALADNANDEGDCYPSVTTLCRKCGASRSTVLRSIAALESARHLTRDIRSGRSTLYRVHPCPTDTSIQQTLVSSRHPTRVPQTPHPCPTDTHNHQITVTEPSRRAASGEPDSIDKALFAAAREVFGQSIGGKINEAIRLKGKPWVLGMIESCRSKDPEQARAYFIGALKKSTERGFVS